MRSLFCACDVFIVFVFLTQLMIPLPVLETQMHPYQLVQLRQCMQNSARMQQLGIPALVSMLGTKRLVPQNNATANHRKDKDCDPDYQPELDETIDGDLCGTNNTKVLIPSIQ